MREHNNNNNLKVFNKLPNNHKKYCFIVLQIDTISHETSPDRMYQERYITSVVSY